MSNDLISRSALLEEINSYVFDTENADKRRGECEAKVHICKLIENQPTAYGSGAGIKEGMAVYGLMLSSGGYFAAEGVVARADQEGFCVNYKMLAGVRYKYSDIGRNIYLDKETAYSEAETAQYETKKAEKENFEEQNKKPFGKF